MASWGDFFDGTYKLGLRLFSGRPLVMTLLFGLLVLSGAAALKGIVDFVTETEAKPNPVVWVVVGFGVALITLAMWIALERARLPGPVLSRVLAFIFYLFCALWSIGFGFGFWWGLLAAKAETTETLQSAANDFTTGVTRANARITAIQTAFSRVQASSMAAQNKEEHEGSSCGVQSGIGQATYYRRRSAVTERIANLGRTLQTDWLVPMQQSINEATEGFRTTRTAAEAKNDYDRRTDYDDFFASVKRRAVSLNETSRTQSHAISGELKALARELNTAPGQPNFNCYDPILASELTRASTQVQDYVRLRLHGFNNATGAAATRQAFTRLYGSLLAPALEPFLHFSTPPVAQTTESGASQQTEDAEDEEVVVEEAPRMLGRDWIALMATIIVDVGILFFTLIRPRTPLEGFMTARDFRTKLTRALVKQREAASEVLHELTFEYQRRLFGVGYYFALPSPGWVKAGDARGPAGSDVEEDDPYEDEEQSSRVYASNLQTIVGLLEAGNFTDSVWRPSNALQREAASTLKIAQWDFDPPAPRPHIFRVRFRDLTELRFIFSEAPEQVRKLEREEQEEKEERKNRDRGGVRGQTNWDKAPPEISLLMQQYARLERQIGEEEEPRMVSKLNDLRREVRNSLEEAGVEPFGADATGILWEPDRGYVRDGLMRDAAPKNTILKVTKVGFRVRLRNRKFKVLSKAEVVVSDGRGKVDPPPRNAPENEAASAQADRSPLRDGAADSNEIGDGAAAVEAEAGAHDSNQPPRSPLRRGEPREEGEDAPPN